MHTSLTRVSLCLFLVALPLLAACSSDIAGHDVSRGGVSHKAGLEDPLANCVSCHGSDLQGNTGPSCYSCHGIPSSHSTIRGGKAHSPEATPTCAACHGPNNTGGLGPACSTCHD